MRLAADESLISLSFIDNVGGMGGVVWGFDGIVSLSKVIGEVPPAQAHDSPILFQISNYTIFINILTQCSSRKIL